MTPPHPSDRTDRISLVDQTAPLTGAEVSQVNAMARALNEMILPAVRAELGRTLAEHRDSIEGRLAKAEETSTSAIRLPKRVRTWQAIAAALLSLTVGSAGAFAGVSITVDRVEARQGVSEQAAADAAAEARAAAVLLAAPRQEPADVGRLADTLDRVDRRLEGLEARMERLESRRGR